MKLKEYIKNLQDFAEEHPEALEYTVIYAKDSEGNGYEEVYFEPSLGCYNDYEFHGPERDDLEPNAVCIN